MALPHLFRPVIVAIGERAFTGEFLQNHVPTRHGGIAKRNRLQGKISVFAVRSETPIGKQQFAAFLPKVPYHDHAAFEIGVLLEHVIGRIWIAVAIELLIERHFPAINGGEHVNAIVGSYAVFSHLREQTVAAVMVLGLHQYGIVIHHDAPIECAHVKLIEAIDAVLNENAWPDAGNVAPMPSQQA